MDMGVASNISPTRRGAVKNPMEAPTVITEDTNPVTCISSDTQRIIVGKVDEIPNPAMAADIHMIAGKKLTNISKTLAVVERRRFMISMVLGARQADRGTPSTLPEKWAPKNMVMTKLAWPTGQSRYLMQNVT
jgi:hypothetical protein